jgi:hypothetical protein
MDTNAAWCDVDGSKTISGTGNATVTITADSTAGPDRSTTITIDGIGAYVGVGQKTVSVVQNNI